MKSNIRKLRNERNISQTTLAEIIGKTQQTISHMENDRDRIPIECLIKMSEYFGVSTDYILGLVPEENNSRKTQRIEKSSPQAKAEQPKEAAADNKKILYQLILTLLLDSIDDGQSVIDALESRK